MNSKHNLKLVFRHLIKKELELQIENNIIEDLANDFDNMGLDSLTSIVSAKQQMSKTHNPARLLATIEELLDEEYFPALKEKLIKRILDKLLAEQG